MIVRVAARLNGVLSAFVPAVAAAVMPPAPKAIRLPVILTGGGPIHGVIARAEGAAQQFARPRVGQAHQRVGARSAGALDDAEDSEITVADK